MASYINGKPVMFLKEESKTYLNGDRLNMVEHGFLPDAIFIDLEYEKAKQIHIIKNNLIHKSVKLKDLKEEDFIDIQAIYDFNGKELKLYNLEDVYQYVYEERRQSLDLEFQRMKYDRMSKQIVMLEYKKADLVNILDINEMNKIVENEMKIVDKKINLRKYKELNYAYEKFLIDKNLESVKIILEKNINEKLYEIKEQCKELSAIIYMEYNSLSKWYK